MWYLSLAVLAFQGGLLILADLGRLLPPSFAAVDLARCCGAASAATVEPSLPLAGAGDRSTEPVPTHDLQVYRGAPPQARYSPVILVATVDGIVSALNASSGQILWTRDSLGGPVVQNLPVRPKPRPKGHTAPAEPEPKAENNSQDRSSNTEDAASAQLVPDSDPLSAATATAQWVTSSASPPRSTHSPLHAMADIHLVAPFDSGKIYKLRPDKVLIDSLLTVKELVHKSPSRSNGMLYLGSKRTKYFALDVATGRVVNAFGTDDGDFGSPEHEQAASWLDSDSSGASPLLSQIEDRQTIYLARTEYRLRIYNSHTSELKWNVLYSEYEPDSVLPLAQHSALHASQQLRLFTSHQGLLVAQDPRSEEIVWTQQLPSSATTVFRLWTYGAHNPWILMTSPLDRLDPSDTTPTSSVTPRSGQASGQPVALHSQYTTHSALVDTTEDGGLFVYPGPAPVASTVPLPKPGVKQIIQTVSRKLIEKITSWPSAAPRHHQWTGRDLIDEHLPMLWRMPRAFADRFIVQPLLRELWAYQSPGLLDSIGYNASSTLPPPLFASSADKMTTPESGASTLAMDQHPLQLTHDAAIDGHGTFANPAFDPIYPRRIGHLLISEHVLGRGSHGTCVYLGKFGADRVAVKQLLTTNYDIADREVSILEASRSHPNVIQYRCCTRDRQFLYIALDLCQASLYDLVQAYQVASTADISATPIALNGQLASGSSEAQWQQSQHSERQLLGQVLPSICPRQALRGMAEGLDFLHRCNIVHRDLKPQNILVQSATLERWLEDYRESVSSEGGQFEGQGIVDNVLGEKPICSPLSPSPTGFDTSARAAALAKFRQGLAAVLTQPRSTDAADPLHIRLLISDFGLCKKLELGQNTFFNTTAHGLGTLGWRAPECIRDPSRLDQLVLRASSGSSRPTSHSAASSAVATPPLAHTVAAAPHSTLESIEPDQ
ncbi:bifunctional endoribonuclease/protein kinase ire1, partial [Dimargaris verticillata]